MEVQVGLWVGVMLLCGRGRTALVGPVDGLAARVLLPIFKRLRQRAELEVREHSPKEENTNGFRQKRSTIKSIYINAVETLDCRL